MRTQLNPVGGALLAALMVVSAAAAPIPFQNATQPATQSTAQPAARYAALPAATATAAQPWATQPQAASAYNNNYQRPPATTAPRAAQQPIGRYNYNYVPPQQAQPRVAYQQPTLAEQQLPTSDQQLPATPEPLNTPSPAPSTSLYDPAPQPSDTPDQAPVLEPEPATTSYSLAAPAADDCNCNGPQASAVNSYSLSPTADTGGYDCTASANCDCGPRRRWFAGVYVLGMKRDNPGTTPVAVLIDSTTTPDTDVYLRTSDANTNCAGGGEIRFGSTFGCGSDCGACQPFAWEIGYWAIESETSSARLTDSFGVPTRIYSLVNYAGLEYDVDGTGGWDPLNNYFDYQMPIGSNGANDIRVLANEVRQSFQAHNLEINFWRFGAGAACDSCSPCCEPASCVTFSGLAGVRFIQFDELLSNTVYFTVDDGAGNVVAGQPGSWLTAGDDNIIHHAIDVDNDLVGFQIGGSLNRQVGCRWSLFCDSNLGVYNNNADVSQRISTGGVGDVRFAQDGAGTDIRSSKSDVAFLGEARLGVGYQFDSHWRATAAWRVLAVSGVALANEQIPQAGYVNSTVVGTIDNNDSIVLHGLQLGIECKY